MDDREFWMEKRRALLTEIKAIERRFSTPVVTVTMKREEAETRGLCKPADTVVSLAQT